MENEKTDDMCAVFNNRQLEFRHGLILTCDMLEEIYSYPRFLSKIECQNYSDGILCGVNFVERDGFLIITAGVLKFKDDLYVMKDDFNLTHFLKTNGFLENSDRLYLYLVPQDIERLEASTVKSLKLTVTSKKYDSNYGIALGNIRHEENLYLRIPDSLDNFKKKSRIEILEVPFASLEVPTFHPIVFKAVKRFLKTKMRKNGYDWYLLFVLSEHNVLSLDTVVNYIAATKNKMPEDGNEVDGPSVELFENFVQCLRLEPEIEAPEPVIIPEKPKTQSTRTPSLKKNRYN